MKYVYVLVCLCLNVSVCVSLYIPYFNTHKHKPEKGKHIWNLILGSKILLIYTSENRNKDHWLQFAKTRLGASMKDLIPFNVIVSCAQDVNIGNKKRLRL